ncbi:MAG TPA: PfkB family carbohydrate kinase, partial [Thermomicrobiales bacterium]|nr:PfkB family carbohydrate kinase [Thermomicrobiales bacterium]
ITIPIVAPEPLVDPTGGGDAYRAGLLKGLLLGLHPKVAGRMAALAATFAIERYGTQEHAYDAGQFVERFEHSFPDFRGTITEASLRTPAPSAPGR